MQVYKTITKETKLKVLFGILILSAFLLIVLPSLARYRNRSTTYEVVAWDGSVANSYRSGTGTANDPYVISNGAELAYFAEMLNSTNYAGTYFVLGHDIVLNNGIFSYDDTSGGQYKLNNSQFYIKENTTEFYDNVEHTGVKIGDIQEFYSLDGFSGYFDGDSHTIYGLYLADTSASNLGLFTNLQGTISNLYVENAFVYGGIKTGGIVSDATGAHLENVLFNGYVVGNKEVVTNSLVHELVIDDVTLSATTTTLNVDLNIPTIEGKINSITLNGNLEMTGDAGTVKINGNTLSTGSIQLTIDALDKLVIDYETSGDTVFKLTNMTYTVEYNEGLAGGIVGLANDTNLVNVINKGYIYAYTYSGGLVGSASTGLAILQSYNTGKITSSTMASGIVGAINNASSNLTIDKAYQAGELDSTNNSGLVGDVFNNESNLTINNSFTVNSSYVVNSSKNATITANNVYYTTGTSINTGSFDGSIINTTETNLKSKSFLIDTLSYYEFIDNVDLASNDSHVWVFENGGFPILHIDDLNFPVANIHVSTYTWNDLGYELNSLSFADDVSFSIESADDLKPLTEAYYYISNSKDPLLRNEIESIDSWVSYENIVTINQEGFYVIYVKAIDYLGNTTYLNTDLLVIDKSQPEIKITLEDNNWQALNDSPDFHYINETKELTIDTTDAYSGVATTQYYVSNEIMTEEQLLALDMNEWQEGNLISINQEGTYIVYAKAVDNVGHVTFVNTDYVVYGGYKMAGISLGRSADMLTESVNITNDSSVSLHFTYSDVNAYLENYKHNLVSNLLLPKGTKITLYDQKNNKAYSYEITTTEDIYNYEDSCLNQESDCVKTALYPFTLFEEVGKGTMSNYYTEVVNDTVDESYKILLDFSGTNLTTDYENLKLYIDVRDSNNEIVRSTLDDTIKTFNIYTSTSDKDYSAKANITSSYDGTTIFYNSNSTTNINLNTSVLYEKANNEIINDSTLEGKRLGISVRIVDNNSNKVGREYFSNLRFKVNGNYYSPDNEGVVRIDLNNGILDTDVILTIETYHDTTTYMEGEYYFAINSYVAYDGLYSLNNSSTDVKIPITFTNEIIDTNYSFNVLTDDDAKIINKDVMTYQYSLDAIQAGSFVNPNIRVSLYKKSQLTAYNQDYTLINLQDYITNQLTLIGNNTYYLFQNPLSYDGTINTYNHLDLSLDVSKMENNGYKLIFELYDGNRRVSAIEKKFIIK